MLTWVIKQIEHSLTRTFGGTKIVFPCNFHNISYAKFFITFAIMYIILKITIGYYIYNICGGSRTEEGIVELLV